MPAPPAPAVALDSNQDDFTDGGGIVPDSPAVDDSPVVDNPATPKEGLVEAVVCSLGHENAPHSGTCSSCGTAIPTDAPSVLVEQPTIGKLVFLDGQSVPVNGQLVLGRRPTIEPGQGLCIAIDQAEVSRSHATITVDGWSAYVTDLGSRNGTFVVAPDNPSPVKLDAHAQHFLEPGTTIHLGGSEASFTYLGNDD